MNASLRGLYQKYSKLSNYKKVFGVTSGSGENILTGLVIARQPPSSNKAFPEHSGGNTIFPLIKKKKKFENFLKQLGDSPEKKRNISANVPEYAMFGSGIICPKGDRWQIWV
ncbi:MAG: hypothetical protein WC101_02300 [Candidatus Gracilibacteria bacterium]